MPSTNHVLKVLQSAALKAPATMQRKRLGMPVHALVAIVSAAAKRPVASTQDLVMLGYAIALAVGFFFLLRPTEFCGDGAVDRGRPLSPAHMRFAARVQGTWTDTSADPTSAEVVILYLPGRKADSRGEGAMLVRWRSGHDTVCPVILLGHLHRIRLQVWPGVAREAPLFPGIGQEGFAEFCRVQCESRGLRGRASYCARITGAEALASALALKIHKDTMQQAGGWSSEEMPTQYGGYCMETTRSWSAVMLQGASAIR